MSNFNTLLNTRYSHLARNTIDYWMLPDQNQFTESDILNAMMASKPTENSKLQLYLHIPYCAQLCSFCAFSGGNNISWKEAEKYTELLIWQLKDLLKKTKTADINIESVNIGGGSPDLIGTHMDTLLTEVKQLNGMTDNTEISVEFTLSTVKKDFIDILAKHEVTKVSFGVQTTKPHLRKYMKQPAKLNHLDKVITMLDGRIPIVNADLITCLPGQTLDDVHEDLQAMMNHPGINAISTYLLTPGAAPSLLADLSSGKIPPQASPDVQAKMRLHSYATLQKNGWVRRGTNTYYDAHSIPKEILEKVKGNECIGTADGDDFLIAAGAQAISSLPGVRIENTVDINQWIEQTEKKKQAIFLPKCNVRKQEDTALWVFPLRHEGLLKSQYNRMLRQNAIDEEQVKTFKGLIEEGLIVDSGDRYELSILGEVFMGRIVYDLKKEEGKQTIKEYIDEGYLLGKLLGENNIRAKGFHNNRQIATKIIDEFN
ncbi:radical SAM protein [Vibrio sp. S9_S30]|uniref:radical SAM protein n=1 Tax=Vibrio sp. S9_S30 TaxID=2720226 RepID=UPI0016809D5E|nr:radical SAM protein [Vibrio sp. S9_S30]MBD1557782.1 radical SAM protein [Vibrio sp. S9_S30]